MKHIVLSIFLIGVALCLLIALVVAGPFIYNYHLSPLAVLSDDIQIGQEFDDVERLSKEYYEKYRGDDEIYLNTGITKELSAKPSKAPEDGKYIHLYHWMFMDDLQLTIYFDTNGKVAHMLFIGD